MRTRAVMSLAYGAGRLHEVNECEGYGVCGRCSKFSVAFCDRLSVNGNRIGDFQENFHLNGTGATSEAAVSHMETINKKAPV
jgi:hypothetical protein